MYWFYIDIDKPIDENFNFFFKIITDSQDQLVHLKKDTLKFLNFLCKLDKDTETINIEYP